MKVLIAAGGTGGHLFPAQQLAEMLKVDSEILFAGHKIGTSPFFEKTGIPFAEISSHPLKIGFFTAVWKGFWQARKLIRQFAPDVIVGFGSYHAFPILLAAAILRKKIVLFEANVQLGKVNRLLSPFAHLVAFQFPCKMKKGVLVPWLPWISEPVQIGGDEAKKLYGLEPGKTTILIFGGSQGASFLNERAPHAIANLHAECQVIHFTGPSDEYAVRSTYEKLGIAACVKSFEKKMANAYAAADFAICRSGAGTIAELIRFQLPAVLIPFPFAAENHQMKNGQYLMNTVKAARLVDQKDAHVKRLADELNALMMEKEEKSRRLSMENLENKQRIHLAEIIRNTF